MSQAEHGRGWIGHLVRRYHVQAWVQNNAPKLVGFGQGLAKPALTLGKGALSLLLALLTIFVLVLLLLLEGTEAAGRPAGPDVTRTGGALLADGPRGQPVGHRATCSGTS